MKSLAQSRGPIHLGLDVHKLSITAGVLEAAASAPVLQRIGSDDAAVRQLIGKCGDPSRLKVCYEAGPTGFTLARTLESWGVACDVVAPSRIPKQSGDRVKTDKRDGPARGCTGPGCSPRSTSRHGRSRRSGIWLGPGMTSTMTSSGCAGGCWRCCSGTGTSTAPGRPGPKRTISGWMH